MKLNKAKSIARLAWHLKDRPADTAAHRQITTALGFDGRAPDPAQVVRRLKQVLVALGAPREDALGAPREDALDEFVPHEVVRLTRALPDCHLAVGEVGAVVHTYHGRQACEVEFPTAAETFVVCVPIDSLERSTG